MPEQQQETSSRLAPLDQDRQLQILQESEAVQPDPETSRLMRANLDQGGLGRALLGEMIRARTIAREKLADVPFEKGETAVLMGVKLQGQMKGIDLCIDIIFELANWNAMQELTHVGDENG